MAEVRRSTRQRESVDYKLLASGPEIPTSGLREKSKTWSTNKLYALEVVDSKVVDNQLLVKVHYTDEEWDSPIYDEWRNASEVIDVPDCYIHFTEETRNLFVNKLGVVVKEALHCQRKVDSIVHLDIDVQRDLFVTLFDKPACFARHNIASPSEWNHLLGNKWNYRIVNSKGDFAYVTPGTISFWIRERKPLEEFTPEGTLLLVHRGFVFHVQFVRGLGNKYDFEQFIVG